MDEKDKLLKERLEYFAYLELWYLLCRVVVRICLDLVHQLNESTQTYPQDDLPDRTRITIKKFE